MLTNAISTNIMFTNTTITNIAIMDKTQDTGTSIHMMMSMITHLFIPTHTGDARTRTRCLTAA